MEGRKCFDRRQLTSGCRNRARSRGDGGGGRHENVSLVILQSLYRAAARMWGSHTQRTTGVAIVSNRQNALL